MAPPKRKSVPLRSRPGHPNPEWESWQKERQKEADENTKKAKAEFEKKKESRAKKINYVVESMYGAQKALDKANEQNKELQNTVQEGYKEAVNNQVQEKKDAAYPYKLGARATWEAIKLTSAGYGAYNSLRFLRGKELGRLAGENEYLGMALDGAEMPGAMIDLTQRNPSSFVENSLQEGAGYYNSKMGTGEYKVYDATTGIDLIKASDKFKWRYAPGIVGLLANGYQIGSSIYTVGKGIYDYNNQSTEQKQFGGTHKNNNNMNYTITDGGETRVRFVPSTGKRTKAEFGWAASGGQRQAGAAKPASRKTRRPSKPVNTEQSPTSTFDKSKVTFNPNDYSDIDNRDLLPNTNQIASVPSDNFDLMRELRSQVRRDREISTGEPYIYDDIKLSEKRFGGISLKKAHPLR